MWKEFKEFAMKGNVVDLAIGVIIGAAFGKIVTSIVEDIFTPLLGIILGKVDFAGLSVKVGDATIKYGMFLNALINFLIVALALFLAVKAINRFRAQAPEVPPPPPSREEELLTEIRDAIKASRGA